MMSSFITHLNPSSNENLLLAITDLTLLEMRLGKSSIYYMSRVRGIAQWMHGVTIDRIIPLLVIASLDHERYTGVKSRYLAGDTALVNCNPTTSNRSIIKRRNKTTSSRYYCRPPVHNKCKLSIT